MLTFATQGELQLSLDFTFWFLFWRFEDKMKTMSVDFLCWQGELERKENAHCSQAERGQCSSQPNVEATQNKIRKRTF